MTRIGSVTSLLLTLGLAGHATAAHDLPATASRAERISALTSRAMEVSSRMGNARARANRGTSEATLLEATATVVAGVGLRAGFGLGVSAQGGERTAQLVLHGSRVKDGGGAYFSFGPNRYARPRGAPIPRIEHRQTEALAFAVIGLEKSESLPASAPASGIAKRWTLGAALVDGGDANEVRRNLVLPLWSWRSRELRRADRGLELALSTFPLLNEAAAGNDRALAKAERRITRLEAR